MEINEKALERVDRMKKEVNGLQDCLDYRVCPACAGNLILALEVTEYSTGSKLRTYKCLDCYWEIVRHRESKKCWLAK